MSKKMDIKTNFAGGVDLTVERDAGNPVTILTGRTERSLEFWKELRQLATLAIEEMDPWAFVETD